MPVPQRQDNEEQVREFVLGLLRVAENPVEWMFGVIRIARAIRRPARMTANAPDDQQGE